MPSFDLHVSGTPLAFILSQDQTLRKTFHHILRRGSSRIDWTTGPVGLPITLQLLRCRRQSGGHPTIPAWACQEQRRKCRCPTCPSAWLSDRSGLFHVPRPRSLTPSTSLGCLGLPAKSAGETAPEFLIIDASCAPCQGKPGFSRRFPSPPLTWLGRPQDRRSCHPTK